MLIFKLRPAHLRAYGVQKRNKTYSYYTLTIQQCYWNSYYTFYTPYTDTDTQRDRNTAKNKKIKHIKWKWRDWMNEVGKQKEPQQRQQKIYTHTHTLALIHAHMKSLSRRWNIFCGGTTKPSRQKTHTTNQQQLHTVYTDKKKAASDCERERANRTD